MTIKFENANDFQPINFFDRHFTFQFFMCCAPPFGVIHHQVFPVFRPNQFFWDNFWDEKKETKAELYMRTIRGIMIRHGKFYDSNKEFSDLMEYMKDCNSISNSIN